MKYHLHYHYLNKLENSQEFGLVAERTALQEPKLIWPIGGVSCVSVAILYVDKLQDVPG